ncbi:MAG: succinylglutamate desuccinylase/aspartoacylase family protein [Chitinophagales bacterium]
MKVSIDSVHETEKAGRSVDLKREAKRIIGNYTQGKEGPLLIVTGAIHGNEPAGVKALQVVLTQLKDWEIPIEGQIIGLIGNLQAFSKSQRYISKDLNRQWKPENVLRVKRTPKEKLKEEDAEQKELIEFFERTLNEEKFQSDRRVVLLDLHTTSADGVAYSIVTSIGGSRKIAESLGVPTIMGFDKAILGTTLNYFSDLGLESFCFEAGQHDAESSVTRTISAIWQVLVGLGCIEAREIPFFNNHKGLLHELGEDLPRTVQYKYRHVIVPEDCFKMLLGFDNFQYVEKGQLLAHDKDGKIRAPFSGVMLMPLYQAQGKDGFFIVEEISKLIVDNE